jgi:hypothetical protein
MENAPNVFAVRGASGTWKQLAVVTDGQILWLEMQPALLAGWNLKSYWVSAGDDWMGMTADQIIAWKQRSGFPFELADASETAYALRRAAGQYE